MDCVKLIEDGTYKKEDLNERNKTFIDGMEFLKNEVINKNFFGEGDFDDSFSPTLTKVIKEITDNVIDTMADYAKIIICEAIVSFADEEDADKSRRSDATYTMDREQSCVSKLENTEA